MFVLHQCSQGLALVSRQFPRQQAFLVELLNDKGRICACGRQVKRVANLFPRPVFRHLVEAAILNHPLVNPEQIELFTAQNRLFFQREARGEVGRGGRD